MHKNIFIRPFAIATLAYFIGMAVQNSTMQFICKPLLVTLLLLHFISVTKKQASTIKKIAIGAFVFSIAGDTLLMFANRSEIYFLLGLSAFLIAHILYILTFHKIKIKEDVGGKWQWAIVVAIYYFFIITLLLPHLGDMKIPVLVYGLVISFMLLIAAFLYDLEDNITAQYIFTGAILFIVSDSILAINKFYYPFAGGGWAIMITYILAQYLLVNGIARYIVKNAK